MVNPLVKSFFNKKANEYIANNYFLKKRAEFIKNNIDYNKKILDVGIGTGELAAFYSHGFINGCDISMSMIKIAQKKLPKSEFKVCDAESLNYGDESFDIIIASELIYYLTNQNFFFLECKRVLKRKGKLILIWGNQLYNPFYKIASFFKLRSPDPFSLYTPNKKDIERILKDSKFNFKIVFFGIGLPSFLNGNSNKTIVDYSPIISLIVNKE